MAGLPRGVAPFQVVWAPANPFTAGRFHRLAARPAGCEVDAVSDRPALRRVTVAEALGHECVACPVCWPPVPDARLRNAPRFDWSRLAGVVAAVFPPDRPVAAPVGNWDTTLELPLPVNGRYESAPGRRGASLDRQSDANSRRGWWR